MLSFTHIEFINFISSSALFLLRALKNLGVSGWRRGKIHTNVWTGTIRYRSDTRNGAQEEMSTRDFDSLFSKSRTRILHDSICKEEMFSRNYEFNRMFKKYEH